MFTVENVLADDLNNEDSKGSSVESMSAVVEVTNDGIAVERLVADLEMVCEVEERLNALKDVVAEYGISKGQMKAVDATETLKTYMNISDYDELPEESVKDEMSEAAVEGLGEALKKVWESIKKFFSALWSKIKEIFTKVKNWIMKIFKKSKDKAKAVIAALRAPAPSGASAESLEGAVEADDGLEITYPRIMRVFNSREFSLLPLKAYESVPTIAEYLKVSVGYNDKVTDLTDMVINGVTSGKPAVEIAQAMAKGGQEMMKQMQPYKKLDDEVKQIIGCIWYVDMAGDKPKPVFTTVETEYTKRKSRNLKTMFGTPAKLADVIEAVPQQILDMSNNGSKLNDLTVDLLRKFKDMKEPKPPTPQDEQMYSTLLSTARQGVVASNRVLTKISKFSLSVLQDMDGIINAIGAAINAR